MDNQNRTTNQERAEKIFEALNGYNPRCREGDNSNTQLIVYIASQLDEAEREVKFEATEEGLKKAFEMGFAAARDKAAGIVEERMEQNAISTDLYTLPWS